jgi:hypothetical protein
MWQLEIAELGSVRVSVDVYRWGQSAESSFDGTVILSAVAPETCPGKLTAYIHGRFDQCDQAVLVPLTERDVRDIVEHARAEGWAPGSEQHEYGLADVGWLLDSRPIPNTHAPHYEGVARNFLTEDLHLLWEDWMQDWPLEVSDPGRIEEFCAYYDAATDNDIRFDVMGLALYSLEELGVATEEGQAHWAWFEKRLAENFGLHGHPIAYWALLDEPELEHDRCFGLSPVMRKVWTDGLILMRHVKIVRREGEMSGG